MDDQALRERLLQAGYIADEGLAIPLGLATELQRPPFLEGDAGVGKKAPKERCRRRFDPLARSVRVSASVILLPLAATVAARPGYWR